MSSHEFVTIEGKQILIEGEKNLLELIRKAKIEIPTFCYHSELSVYGACRLCLVDIEGMGLQASCSISPKDGMKVNVHTQQIRDIRRTNIELLLAAGNHNCTTCIKNGYCKLQEIAKKLGLKEIRFKQIANKQGRDTHSHSLVRDPSKCILCGDCTRMCSEIQGIGVIDFAGRGSKTRVLPTFGKHLNKVECVNCGQCAKICPTGALSSKSALSQIWQDIWNENKKVAIQIAPAVRIALGEMFGLKEGENSTGLIVTALRMLGFDYVYDTSFGADLTIFEEANEFLNRFMNNEKLPMFTSCCPAWVKHAEHCYADLLDNLSTCKSPQQMLGSMIKEDYIRKGKKRSELSIVSVMPCTAKKYEAKRIEFYKDNDPDVSNVLTTMELARMIGEKGINFLELEPSSFDMPFGFKTGAGIIFGHAGGVTEAVIRFVLGKLNPSADYRSICKVLHESIDFKELELKINDRTVKMAAVNGLKNAQKLIKDIETGKKYYDFVEVMACPSGCVNGAGQPVSNISKDIKKRVDGIYKIDSQTQLHKSQDNHYIAKLYEEVLNEVGSTKAHELLHTHYHSQKRIKMTEVPVITDKTNIEVCFGTSCVLKGSRKLLSEINSYVKGNKIDIEIKMIPSFCFERCNKGPVVKIDDLVIEKANMEKIIVALEQIKIKKSVVV